MGEYFSSISSSSASRATSEAVRGFAARTRRGSSFAQQRQTQTGESSAEKPRSCRQVGFAALQQVGQGLRVEVFIGFVLGWEGRGGRGEGAAGVRSAGRGEA